MPKLFNLVAPVSGHSAWSALQQDLNCIEALPAEFNLSIAGHAYIYDLIEQRNLSGSCSVATLLGYPVDDIAASDPLDLASLIHPDDLDRVADYFQRLTTLRVDEVISIEYRMQRADGQWCWVRSQETPLVQSSRGFPLQILGIIQVLDQGACTGMHSEQELLFRTWQSLRRQSPIAVNP